MAHTNDGFFVWYDHLTRDVPAAIAFYSEVVGWKTQPFGQNDYQMWSAGQGPLGGVMAIEEEHARSDMRPHWMAHVQVRDVDVTAKGVVAQGGRLCTPPTDIPTVGRFAVIADPQGASLSIFTPSQNDMQLHDLSKEGEFCWNELLTSDSAAAARFYAELLGWKILEEMDMGPMGTYRIFGLGERRLGGMYTVPKEQRSPPAWLYYATTRDLDGAVARATRKGAKLLNGPMEVPGGLIAQLLDPQGAAFALHEERPR